ncbi:carbohydrate ABC transporter permease [Salinispora cortesiana]|uniref:carbohydrate ABC transporter permease n=1 Tax=Salinispora cortesiana TaxID=1305843 RepID=UPI00041BD3FF|nr:carbohydrate ABC transporter permease [Salinispora cortesiana]
MAILLAVGALLTSFPFVWMLTTSVKPLGESRQYPPRVLPSEVSLASYQRLFEDLDFGRYLFNTIIVVLISFAGLLLMAMAGYGFAKFRFPGRGMLFALVLATMMIPLQVTMIPTYLLLNEAGLTNTLVGIALPALVSAFSVFLFRQFMLTIPDELLEAARLDGAGETRVFASIVLPLSRPILAVQAVLTFIAGWNSFLWPLIVANDEEKYTLAVGLSLLNQQLSVNPPLQMAGASLMVVPIVIIFVVFSRHIVRGFTMSGMK